MSSTSPYSRKPASRPRVVGAMGSTTARAHRMETAALVLPSLLPIVILSVVPLVWGVLTAFMDVSLAPNGATTFVGLSNFGTLASYSLFWHSFRIGLIWSVVVTGGQFLGGLGLALLLNSELRLRGLTRVLALLPWAMPQVAVAIIWQLLYSPTHGPIDWLVGALGGPTGLNWLGDFSLALPAVMVVGIWVGMPQNTIVLLAGLQQVPAELTEAAALDGAGAWSRFLHVTVPAVRQVGVSISALSFIWNFNSFGLVYVLTQGGPGGKTLLPMLFTYVEAFSSRNIGLAAAMGDVITVFLVVVLSAYVWLQLRQESAT